MVMDEMFEEIFVWRCWKKSKAITSNSYPHATENVSVSVEVASRGVSSAISSPPLASGVLVRAPVLLVQVEELATKLLLKIPAGTPVVAEGDVV